MSIRKVYLRNSPGHPVQTDPKENKLKVAYHVILHRRRTTYNCYCCSHKPIVIVSEDLGKNPLKSTLFNMPWHYIRLIFLSCGAQFPVTVLGWAEQHNGLHSTNAEHDKYRQHLMVAATGGWFFLGEFVQKTIADFFSPFIGRLWLW